LFLEYKNWFHNFISSIKLKDLLKFLKFTISKNAIQNSKAANPNKKKLKENKIRSSFTPPQKTEKQYKVNQVNSE
jgi:hypothetical protein